MLVACAAFFSPISITIFFPAITEIARDLARSTENVNLSLTVYLVFQAITPSFFGSLADLSGSLTN